MFGREIFLVKNLRFLDFLVPLFTCPIFSIKNCCYFWLFIHLGKANWPAAASATYVSLRYCHRFFDQVGHQTMYACIGKKHFFTISCHRQTYQNYEQSRQKLGTFLENKVLYFLQMCPIYVTSVHNF